MVSCHFFSQDGQVGRFSIGVAQELAVHSRLWNHTLRRSVANVPHTAGRSGLAPTFVQPRDAVRPYGQSQVSACRVAGQDRPVSGWLEDFSSGRANAVVQGSDSASHFAAILPTVLAAPGSSQRGLKEYFLPCAVAKTISSPSKARRAADASRTVHRPLQGFRIRQSSPRRDSISINVTLPSLISLETRKPPRTSRRNEASHSGGQAGKTRMISCSPGRGATLWTSASCRVVVSSPRCSREAAVGPSNKLMPFGKGANAA